MRQQALRTCACVPVRECACVRGCVCVCAHRGWGGGGGVSVLIDVTPFHLGFPLYRSCGQDQNNKICFRDKLDKVAADARGL